MSRCEPHGSFRSKGTEICVAESCRCMAETSTIFQSNHHPIKNFKLKKKRTVKENHTQNRKTQFPPWRGWSLGGTQYLPLKNVKFKETTFPTLSYFLCNTGQGLLYTSHPGRIKTQMYLETLYELQRATRFKGISFYTGSSNFYNREDIVQLLFGGKGVRWWF